MTIIKLDASGWLKDSDPYRALLEAINAPSWHGCSVDALIDSMIWGGINGVEPPYVVQIVNLTLVPTQVQEVVHLIQKHLAAARLEFNQIKGRDVAVAIEL